MQPTLNAGLDAGFESFCQTLNLTQAEKNLLQTAQSSYLGEVITETQMSLSSKLSNYLNSAKKENLPQIYKILADFPFAHDILKSTVLRILYPQLTTIPRPKLLLQNLALPTLEILITNPQAESTNKCLVNLLHHYYTLLSPNEADQATVLFNFEPVKQFQSAILETKIFLENHPEIKNNPALEISLRGLSPSLMHHLNSPVSGGDNLSDEQADIIIFLVEQALKSVNFNNHQTYDALNTSSLLSYCTNPILLEICCAYLNNNKFIFNPRRLLAGIANLPQQQASIQNLLDRITRFYQTEHGQAYRHGSDSDCKDLLELIENLTEKVPNNLGLKVLNDIASANLTHGCINQPRVVLSNAQQYLHLIDATNKYSTPQELLQSSEVADFLKTRAVYNFVEEHIKEVGAALMPEAVVVFLKHMQQKEGNQNMPGVSTEPLDNIPHPFYNTNTPNKLTQACEKFVSEALSQANLATFAEEELLSRPPLNQVTLQFLQKLYPKAFETLHQLIEEPLYATIDATTTPLVTQEGAGISICERAKNIKQDAEYKLASSLFTQAYPNQEHLATTIANNALQALQNATGIYTITDPNIQKLVTSKLESTSPPTDVLTTPRGTSKVVKSPSDYLVSNMPMQTLQQALDNNQLQPQVSEADIR